MAKIKFTKMQGLGNDFVVLNAFSGSIPEIEAKAKAICDRRFGVGCDQLLVLRPSELADFRMQIFNADGGEVEMCGNGIRCVALYARKRKLTDKDSVAIETLGGLKKVKLLGDRVEVDMGEPVLQGPEIPVEIAGMVIGKNLEAEGASHTITCVGMGNPHCVLFVQDADKAPVKTLGPVLERHAFFPHRTNVEFVEVLDKNNLRIRVWERGAGFTLACGTGACAAAVASVLNGHTNRKVTVHLPGGPLEIEWSEKDNHVYMTGPGVEVFEGEMEI